MAQGNPFDGFGELFDTTFGKKKDKKPEKGVPWNAKKIDGKYYVPLTQVADLLRENDVLPAVRKGIERRTVENWNPDG
jgi:hypothetical protein